MVSLDTYTAGCIHSFLVKQGSLEEVRIDTLTVCFSGLTAVLPYLTGDAKDYFSRLHEMSRIILARLERQIL